MRRGALSLRSWWTEHQIGLLRLAIVLMFVAALFRLSNEFSRLIWEPGPTGAVDLKLRLNEVQLWFAGNPVYRELESAVYPPATFLLLWPLLGWLPVTPARWLWAATTVPALGWLVYLAVRECRAATLLERTAVALLPLSMYATSATIGNGQLNLHILPPLVAGLLLLHHKRREWPGDLVAAALILAALAKPSVSAPFYWMALLVPRTLRPALLIALGYLALTLFAASFQEDGTLALFRDWLAGSLGVRGGYANLHDWLVTLGLEAAALPASLLVLAALGVWTYRHRHGDFWLLLGVTALVARFWTYHRLYDDLLILLPMIALFRLARSGPSDDGRDVTAGVLLVITWMATLAPARVLSFPPPWDWLFATGQTIVWTLVLIFLLIQVRREKTPAHGGVGWTGANTALGRPER
jgi:hypothetical protein